MNGDKLKNRQFEVMKLIALYKNDRKMVPARCEFEDLFKKIQGKGLYEVEVLQGIMEKLINEHNSQLRANAERIRKLLYKEYGNPFKTKYFNGIQSDEVHKAIIENPDKDVYEIFTLFKNRI